MKLIKNYNKIIGKKGEDYAGTYLLKNGYKILYRNFFTKRGEIDIIAQKNNCIIFIEVKTRTNCKYGTPAMSVNYYKKKHIKNSIKIFLHKNNIINHSVRFDVIEVLIECDKYKINHIKNILL